MTREKMKGEVEEHRKDDEGTHHEYKQQKNSGSSMKSPGICIIHGTHTLWGCLFVFVLQTLVLHRPCQSPNHKWEYSTAISTDERR